PWERPVYQPSSWRTCTAPALDRAVIVWEASGSVGTLIPTSPALLSARPLHRDGERAGRGLRHRRLHQRGGVDRPGPPLLRRRLLLRSLRAGHPLPYLQLRDRDVPGTT
ncbi:MAG TPA: hypothetical protein VHH12_06535, partial [Mycobacterium sp.]|nr:hypothetical protein [Mycobacterium sp.]